MICTLLASKRFSIASVPKKLKVHLTICRTPLCASKHKSFNHRNYSIVYQRRLFLVTRLQTTKKTRTLHVMTPFGTASATAPRTNCLKYAVNRVMLHPSLAIQSFSKALTRLTAVSSRCQSGFLAVSQATISSTLLPLLL